MSILNLLTLWTWDRELFRAIHIGMHRDFLDRIMLIISYSGDGNIQIPILVIFLISKKTRKAALAVLACYVLAGGLRLILKEIISRPRPSNYDWAQPLSWPGGMPGGPDGWMSRTFDVIPYGNSSFPSGHTTTSFAIAFMIGWIVYKTEYAWIGWAAFTWACLVGLSRVYIGVHYPADIIAAIALSGICATLLNMLWQSKGWLHHKGIAPADSETSAG